MLRLAQHDNSNTNLLINIKFYSDVMLSSSKHIHNIVTKFQFALLINQNILRKL